MFVLTMEFLVSFPERRIFTSNRFIKSYRNQTIFVGILLILADRDTTSYFVVRPDNKIFLMTREYFPYVKDWQFTHCELSRRSTREKWAPTRYL